MREKIAEIIKQTRLDTHLSSNGVANFVNYPISSEGLAGQILHAISAEIEKGLLTDEEIIKGLWPLFSGVANKVPAEITLTAGDIGIANRRVAQAQLDKILTLLKG
jgi:hypothetical protein